MDDNLITVRTFRWLPEAEAARMFLESEGMKCFLADAEIVNMDWMLGNAVGNIKLRVRESQAQQALELLQQMPERSFADGQEENCAEVVRCLACGASMTEDESTCSECGWTFENAAD